MTQTILDGSTKTTQNQYTGPENELTVDQSNRNLRLHDAATPGGKEFLNRDNADVRYQARSTELDGITEFEPQQKGLLVRLGPSDYRLRTLTVDGASLVVSNANGYLGNPLIGLAATITSEHTWEGQQLFNEVVEFSAGINADVAGDVTGNLTGDVTGNVTGNLTGDATGNHSGAFTGDVDVSDGTIIFADGQIPVEAIGGLVAFVKLHGFPAGAITAWSGAADAVPSGWFLCNGLNGTPDLRSRFLVGAGAGSAYSVGDTGGANSVTPIIDIENDGAHTHALGGSTASAMTGVTLNVTVNRPEFEQHQHDFVENVTLSDPGHSHVQNGTAESNGVHNHAAISSAINNRPPYYALCYIMKG
jgi:microcystin-dependent protein